MVKQKIAESQGESVSPALSEILARPDCPARLRPLIPARLLLEQLGTS